MTHVTWTHDCTTQPFTPTDGSGGLTAARRIHAERYARGEIDDYLERRRRLSEPKS